MILPTGARPKPFAVPGAERVFTVWDALREPDRLGRAVVLIEADGNWPGMATASTWPISARP